MSFSIGERVRVREESTQDARSDFKAGDTGKISRVGNSFGKRYWLVTMDHHGFPADIWEHNLESICPRKRAT